MNRPLERLLAARLETYVAAIADPEAGDTLFELHAAEAWLLVSGRSLRRSALTKEAFRAAHLACAGPREPSLRLGAVCGLKLEAGRATVCFEALETTHERSLALVAGFQEEAGDWKLAWATLATEPVDWTYETGAAQMLSNFTFLRRGTPRAWLDAAYWRLSPKARPLVYLEGQRFSCQGSSDCCRLAWEITVPKEAQDLVDAMPWEQVAPELAGARLRERDGKLVIKERDEDCRFLAPDRRCVIHQALGRPVFPSCEVFPFSFAETPDGVAVTTSFFCGSAREGCGVPLEAREQDLLARLHLGGARATEHYRLYKQLEVSWEVYCDAETLLRMLVRDRTLPLLRRLWLGTRYLTAWTTGETLDQLAWTSEPIAPYAPAEQEAIAKVLEPLFARLGGSVWPRDRAYQTQAPEAFQEPERLAGFFEGLYFAKELAYHFDLATAHNALLFLFLMALTAQGFYPGEPLPAALWQRFGAIASHGALVILLTENLPFRELLAAPGAGAQLVRYALTTAA